MEAKRCHLTRFGFTLWLFYRTFWNFIMPHTYQCEEQQKVTLVAKEKHPKGWSPPTPSPTRAFDVIRTQRVWFILAAEGQQTWPDNTPCGQNSRSEAARFTISCGKRSSSVAEGTGGTIPCYTTITPQSNGDRRNSARLTRFALNCALPKEKNAAWPTLQVPVPLEQDELVSQPEYSPLCIPLRTFTRTASTPASTISASRGDCERLQRYARDVSPSLPHTFSTRVRW